MLTQPEEYNSALFSYLDRCPTAYHAVAAIREELVSNAMIEIRENQKWQLEPGHGYVVIRENCALAAFVMGSKQKLTDGFRMVATHGDSPGLQLKPRAAVASTPYLQLGVEVYGGPLLSTWFDRELSLAGRLSCVGRDCALVDYLIDFRRPLMVIPSLAIHYDREANNGRAIDKQKFMPPLVSQAASDQLPDFSQIVLTQLREEHPDADIEEVLGFDLFCYDCRQAGYVGINNEFLCGGRLDNLLSCHAAATAMALAGTENNTLFFCANHEENGSLSSTGAHGSFLRDIFARLLPDPEECQIALRNSFLLSVDNAHATHPNFKDKSEPQHPVQLNGGPVIKINANQRYATSSRSAALCKMVARQAGVEVQEFVMRSDLACGSTIGPMTAASLGLETIDIGAPTLGMHSIRELTGRNDPHLLFQLIRGFLASPTTNRRATS